jgi:type IV fimbrial biogenesis protein FimT
MCETCGEMHERKAPRSAGEGGFTLVELLIVIAMFSVLVAVGVRGFKQFNESSTVDQAARALSSDVTLARSFAIRRGENVSLVADEGGRSYVIRDASGTILASTHMGATSGTPLTLLDVKATGDSITFNSRGMLTSGGTVEIDVGRTSLTKKVDVSALGRTRIAQVP